MKTKPIPEYGDLMDLDNFITSCKEGYFIDYDGSGNYSDGKTMSDITVYPSDIMQNKIDYRFTHVVWFNR